jgi:hypothetical protein
MKDKQLTDEERQQAREFFAKINIYNDEYERSWRMARSHLNFSTRSSADEVAASTSSSHGSIPLKPLKT